MEALFGQTAVNQVYFFPTGTPAGLVSTMSAAFKAITAEPSVKAAFIKENLTPGYLSQSQATAAVASDLAKDRPSPPRPATTRDSRPRGPGRARSRPPG